MKCFKQQSVLSAKYYVVARVLLYWILKTVNSTLISQMRGLSYRLVEVTAQVSESVKYLRLPCDYVSFQGLM